MHFEPDDEPYIPNGTPKVDILIRWLIDSLGPVTIAQLAAKAISDYEAAELDSDREATLGLLSGALHNELEYPGEVKDPTSADVPF